MFDDPLHRPRARHGRAPDVFRPGGWVPMREHRENEAVDFAIVGTGAGGGTLACKLAEYGFSVVAFDGGPYWRPLEDFASARRSRTSSTGRTSASATARTRCSSAATTAASRSAAAPSISRWCR